MNEAHKEGILRNRVKRAKRRLNDLLSEIAATRKAADEFNFDPPAMLAEHAQIERLTVRLSQIA